MLQNINKIEGGPFGDIKKIRKIEKIEKWVKKIRKIEKIEKWEFWNSLSAEKVERGDPLGFLKLHLEELDNDLITYCEIPLVL